MTICLLVEANLHNIKINKISVITRVGLKSTLQKQIIKASNNMMIEHIIKFYNLKVMILF